MERRGTGMEKVLATFSQLIEERLRLGRRELLTTEDSVRYTFFLALSYDSAFVHTNVTMEYPHPVIKGAEIDTVIFANSGQPSTALEFKFHRENTSGEGLPRPQLAGAVFKDIFRLAQTPNALARKLYFVYLTDHEMASYFRNTRNGVSEFFELGTGNQLDIRSDFAGSFSKTFRKQVYQSQIACSVIGVINREIQAHSLRIYEVQRTE